MQPTPFHSRTAPLCVSNSWLEWAGYQSATMYALEHTHEYQAVRMATALFDVSPLYKFHIHGPDAMRLLDRVLTRDVTRCAVGQVMYSAWCDDAGHIIDDGTLARLEANFYRLTTADPSLAWLQDNGYGMNVQVEDVSESLAALALQGPTSRDLLQSAATTDLSRLGYFRATRTGIGNARVMVTRTGYTGDLGYEVWIEPDDAEHVWDVLMDRGRSYAIKPAGTLALEMVRIEAGLLLSEVDFISCRKTIFEVQKSTPLELGLGWMVHLDKPFFVGQQAIREEKARGPAWNAVGVEIDVLALEAIYAEFGMPLHLPWEAWDTPVPVYVDGQQVGKATSGTWSPTLKKYVALARVRPQHAALGSTLDIEMTVEAVRRTVPAKVVKTPFFDPARKRS
jgi:aminomethyltransferase